MAVDRDVAYASGPRCNLDVYTPAHLAVALKQQQQQQQGAPRPDGSSAQTPAHPVVFFIHGGVWASGENWHNYHDHTPLVLLPLPPPAPPAPKTLTNPDKP